MAEEKQPTDIHEGASTPPPPATGSKEDQRAAAALSNLDTNGEDDGSKKEVDTEALGKAMQNLNVKSGAGAASQKAVVKVNAADVTLLVDQLELNKLKATELLKAHDGDAVKAMTAFVKASA